MIKTIILLVTIAITTLVVIAQLHSFDKDVRAGYGTENGNIVHDIMLKLEL